MLVGTSAIFYRTIWYSIDIYR